MGISARENARARRAAKRRRRKRVRKPPPAALEVVSCLRHHSESLGRTLVVGDDQEDVGTSVLRLDNRRRSGGSRQEDDEDSKKAKETRRPHGSAAEDTDPPGLRAPAPVQGLAVARREHRPALPGRRGRRQWGRGTTTTGTGELRTILEAREPRKTRATGPTALEPDREHVAVLPLDVLERLVPALAVADHGLERRRDRGQVADSRPARPGRRPRSPATHCRIMACSASVPTPRSCMAAATGRRTTRGAARRRRCAATSAAATDEVVGAPPARRTPPSPGVTRGVGLGSGSPRGGRATGDRGAVHQAVAHAAQGHVSEGAGRGRPDDDEARRRAARRPPADRPGRECAWRTSVVAGMSAGSRARACSRASLAIASSCGAVLRVHLGRARRPRRRDDRAERRASSSAERASMPARCRAARPGRPARCRRPSSWRALARRRRPGRAWEWRRP